MEPNASENLTREAILKAFPNFSSVEFSWVGNRRRIRVQGSFLSKSWEQRFLCWIQQYLAQPKAEARYDGSHSLLILLDEPR